MAAQPKISLSLSFTFLLQLVVPLVFLDDLHGSLGVVEREEDLIQPRVTLILRSTDTHTHTHIDLRTLSTRILIFLLTGSSTKNVLH